jgi:hypothetical protein
MRTPARSIPGANIILMFAGGHYIFEKQQLQDYIENRTAEDGSDLASKLQELFQVLNTTKNV